MSSPPAQPSFDFGPPRSPPPVQSPPGQRRFNFLFVGLTILVAVALGGGLLLFSDKGKRPSAAVQERAAVEGAYLHYDVVAAQSLKTLDTDPLNSLVSPSVLNQQATVVQQASESGFRFQVADDHDMRTAIYGGGSLASVDDNLLRHIVQLDKASLTPVATETTKAIHYSIGLRRESSAWIVDSVVTFGAGTGSPISYAAANRGSTISTALQAQIKVAYSRFWTATNQAFSTGNPAPLAATELDPELSQDRGFLAKLSQKNEVIMGSVEHNYRIAQQDDATIWVYDTFADSTYTYDLGAKGPVGTTSTHISRQSFRLKPEGSTWKVDFILSDQ